MARKKGYGQFCPVAKATEILAERWTFLVIRELLYGSHRFGELRRGIPTMSPSLLSRRLSELEDAGILTRHRGHGTGWDYLLTTAGKELLPLVQHLGVWGQRWAQRQVRSDDLDPGVLMWSAHRHINHDALPDRRVVLRFDFPGARGKQKRYWLVIEDGDVDLCLRNPGHEIDLAVVSDLRTLTEVYLGHVEPDVAVRSGKVSLEGTRALVRSFRAWCPRSSFADVERPPA